MSASVIDHSVTGYTGLTYAPPSGSNRLVVMVICIEDSGLGTLTNVVWNGVTRTPALSDAITGVLGNYVCIFDEADSLPATTKAITVNWSDTPSPGFNVFIYTLAGALQSTSVQASASSNNQASISSPQSITMSSIASGWVSIGIVGLRSGSVTSIADTWGTAAFSAQRYSGNGGAGWNVSDYHISTGTTDTYNVSWASASSDIAQDLIGFAPASVTAAPTNGGFSTIAGLSTLGWIIRRRQKLQCR